MIERVEAVTEAMISNLYHIPVKWEPHGERVVWGECQVKFKHRLASITRKGVCHDLCQVHEESVEWARWVDAQSPNARMTLRSMVPQITYKSIWYARNEEDLIVNFCSMCWGMGVKGYPRQWWEPQVRKIAKHYGIFDFLGPKMLCQWYTEAGTKKGPDAPPS